MLKDIAIISRTNILWNENYWPSECEIQYPPREKAQGPNFEFDQRTEWWMDKRSANQEMHSNVL
jgi:hypothetical protein